jgi:hypothetical protein
MYPRILTQIREKIRKSEYVVTFHAREEMNEDCYSVFDVERGLLTGEIIERQKDSQSAEWKYQIKGSTFSNREIEIICKLSLTGKLVIVTVYEP